MPIYDYHCDHCGHSFSQVQSYKELALERCPRCGKKPRRLISSPAIVFKGSGWYKTDSRPAEKSETKSEAKPDAKPDKSETKSEGKSTDTKSSPKKGGASS
jgi:putative FmdB family regulatory protein